MADRLRLAYTQRTVLAVHLTSAVSILGGAAIFCWIRELIR